MFDPALDAAPAPHQQIIEPRFADRQRSPNRKKKSKKLDDLKLVFDFHIPFTSRKKDKKAKKPKKDPRPDDRMGRPVYQEYNTAVPPEPRPLPPHMGYRGPGMHPMPPPPPPPPPQGPRIIQPRGPVTPPITVRTDSSTNSSPSPLSPTREHHRRVRSLSLSQYEERKQVTREWERRQHAERVAQAERAARLQAGREAERIREERDHERRRNDALRAERERQRLIEEERGRRAQAIVARRDREELERRRDAEALERDRREAARRLREEDERFREERDRQERRRAARIPRQPRHAAAIHHHHHHHHDGHDGFEQEARVHYEDRGAAVINDAIRARQAEPDRNYGAQARWPVQGGPRRRRTLGASERWVYDDDRRRWGDPWRRWL
ncbi:MAG: hypothetical protein Q9208_002266 [Pyrenodesmia sp. 3 TL-2023]